MKNCTDSKDTYVGLVYLPPEGSKYAHAEMWDEFQFEFSRIKSLSDNVIIMGDFNSRTSTHSDILYSDDFLCNQVGIDDELLEELNYVKLLIDVQIISYDRCNEDKVLNNYGRKLIDFCKSNNVVILNGRFGEDRMVGKVTCKDVSTVDYVMATPQCLHCVNNFKVCNFSEFLSDVHCSLIFEIVLRHQYSQQNTDHIHINESASHSYRRWNANKKDVFIENIDIKAVQDIQTLMANTAAGSATPEEVNSIAEQIRNIYLASATHSFSSSYHDTGRNRKNNRKWFGRKCQAARRKYHLSRRRYNVLKNENNLKEMKEASKEYKQTRNTFIEKEKHDTESRLNNLRTNKPKDYWKILNRFRK
ncbi:hypothetical protein FSP39_023822 [Pinctada imbricata]|uniref:Endonuclease/exonuclease/phosphatase domain-containing protein n=1 Tax=Pinctada imbricata TaxID=66713 RepID=A0AA89BZU9_PINIB|nr:hypothetical protein FSP39_023822 [Pinctada imbricata]